MTSKNKNKSKRNKKGFVSLEKVTCHHPDGTPYVEVYNRKTGAMYASPYLEVMKALKEDKNNGMLG